MTRTGLALTLALALLVLTLFGAASGTAAVVAALARTGTQAPATAAPPVPRDVLLTGESEAVAASGLQARLRGAAERAGLQLTRIEMRPPAEAGQPLAALIEARGTNDQILSFLHEIESGRPAIVTHEARIARALPLDGGQTHSELNLSAEFHAWHGRMDTGS